jgi:hypothetical protein
MENRLDLRHRTQRAHGHGRVFGQCLDVRVLLVEQLLQEPRLRHESVAIRVESTMCMLCRGSVARPG